MVVVGFRATSDFGPDERFQVSFDGEGGIIPPPPDPSIGPFVDSAGGPGVANIRFSEEDATTPWYTSTQYNSFYDSVSNKTFVARECFFVGPSKRFVRVQAFDHATGLWGRSYNVGSQSALNNDDHGAPSIAMNADGRLVCAWGNHDGNYELAVSTNVRDEKTWTAASDMTGNYTYPHLVLLPSGTMICLMRKHFAPGTGGYAAGAKILAYRPITFAGAVATVAAEVTVGDFGNDSRWYQGNAILREDGLIHQVATRAPFDDSVRLDAYYYKIDIANLKLISVGGAEMAFPVTLAWMNANARIYTTAGGNTSNTPAFAFDTDGRRHVLTHEGGTTDGGGSDAAPQTLKYLLAGASDTAFVGPTDVGSSTQRYNSEALCPLPAGKMRMLWNKDKNALNIRGGSTVGKELAAGAAATAFGEEFTLMEHDQTRLPLSAVVATKDAHADIRALWAEIGADSQDATADERRVYAWGDSGMKSRVKPAYVAPPAFTGDGFWIDLHDTAHVFSDAGGTVPATEGQEILRIKDGKDNANVLVGTGGTAPILRKIGGQLALGFGGASVGSRFARQSAKVWTPNNGFMCTGIFRHWMPSTVSLTLASLDAGVGFARVATLVNTNGRQIRAIAFNGTSSTICASGASEFEYQNDYIVQSFTVGANLHLYVNNALVQTLPITGGLLNASSVALTVGATSASTPTGFFMGACFGLMFRSDDQTEQMRADDYAWALTQLPN